MTKSLPPKSLVLYADDDPDDIELMHNAFLSYSNNVELRTFTDGAALLDYVRNLNSFDPLPCLIILDINMPRLDGKQALRQLRNIGGFEEVPVVLFSTSNMPSEVAFARAFNAGFINKPLHQEQVHQIIDQMVDHCSDEVKRYIRKRN
jgi:CheY-like chemotaxis protein